MGLSEAEQKHLSWDRLLYLLRSGFCTHRGGVFYTTGVALWYHRGSILPLGSFPGQATEENKKNPKT